MWLPKLAYAHAQSIVLDHDYKPLAFAFLQRRVGEAAGRSNNGSKRAAWSTGCSSGLQ